MDCSPPGSSAHGNSPGKSTGVGCHFLLQGIFLIQESNPGPVLCRQILYQLSYSRSPKVTEVCVQVRSDLLQQPRGGAQSPWESSPPSLRLLLSESTSCAGDRSLWSSCSWCSAFSWAQLRSCAGQAPSSIAAPRHRAHKHVCKVFQTTCGQPRKILGRKQFYLWAGMKTVLATASLKMHRLPRQEQFLSLTASLEWLQTPLSQQPLGILPSSFSHSPITGPRLLVETLQSGL